MKTIIHLATKFCELLEPFIIRLTLLVVTLYHAITFIYATLTGSH